MCTLSLSPVCLSTTPLHWSLPGSSVHGILQARILDWVAISSSRESSRPKDWIPVSWISCISRWIFFFSYWAILEFPCHLLLPLKSSREPIRIPCIVQQRRWRWEVMQLTQGLHTGSQTDYRCSIREKSTKIYTHWGPQKWKSGNSKMASRTWFTYMISWRKLERGFQYFLYNW